VQKGRAKFGDRESLDKLIQFVHDGCFYSYMASFPNSEEVRAVGEGLVRSTMIFQFQKLERDPEDGSLVMT